MFKASSNKINSQETDRIPNEKLMKAYFVCASIKKLILPLFDSRIN